MNNKKLVLFLLWTSLNLLIAIDTASAAQDIGVEISGQIVPLVPETLPLPTTFIDRNSDKVIYQAFSSDNITNRIRVIDNKNSGGFWLTLQVTNFSSGINIIPYTNLGIVTLATSPAPKSVDTSESNSPASDDGGTIFAPLDCDWDGVSNFGKFCEETPQGFTAFTGAGETSEAITIMNGANPTGTGRSGQEWVTLGTRLLIPAGTTPGEYQSTFTFTIYTTL